MHDLATIQRVNAEATEQAMTELAEEQALAAIDAERAEAMKRHPAGKRRITEPAPDTARCPHCGDDIPTADDNLAEHVSEYHSARALANGAMDAFTLLDAEDYEDETEPEDADVAEQSWGFIRDQIEAAIESDRARRGIDVDGLRAALKDYDDSLIENTDDGTVWEIRDGSMLADWARKTLGLEA